MLEIYTKITILSPYAKSLDVIYDMCSLWGIRLIASASLSRIVELAIPKIVFKRFFGKEPEIGKFDVPVGTETFIEDVEVISMRKRKSQRERDKKIKNIKIKKKKILEKSIQDKKNTIEKIVKEEKNEKQSEPSDDGSQQNLFGPKKNSEIRSNLY